jgi:hypothetical protein
VLWVIQIRRFSKSSHASTHGRQSIKSVLDCGDRATRFGATTSRRFHNLDKRPDVDEFLGKYSRKARHRYKRITGEGCAGTGLCHEYVGAESLKNAVAA